MTRFLSLLLLLVLPLFSYAINVKIENARIDVDSKNKAGDPVIETHCILHVDGIKGEDFDLVAIVKDDEGNWHKDSYGNTVKTHYKCNATYENSIWNDIRVYLKHSKLAPKSGKHSYEVYLYVYYNKEWYGGVLAGSYTHTGASSDSSSNNSSRNSSSTSSGSNTTTATCGVCHGSGIMTCLGCGGMGGSNQWRCQTTPPYSQYYVWGSLLQEQ